MSDRKLRIVHQANPVEEGIRLVLYCYKDRDLRVAVIEDTQDQADVPSIVLNFVEVLRLIDFLKTHYPEMMK